MSQGTKFFGQPLRNLGAPALKGGNRGIAGAHGAGAGSCPKTLIGYVHVNCAAAVTGPRRPPYTEAPPSTLLLVSSLFLLG